jgi:uncharacterized protein DUF3108
MPEIMKLYLIAPLFSLLVGCSEPSLEYFPLGEKIKWEYRIEKKLSNDQSEGKSIVAQLDSIQVNDINYFPHRYANGETLYYSKNETGILFSSKPDKNGQLLLKYPLELNMNWKSDTRIELLNSRHESFSGGESFISQDEEIVLDNQIVSYDETITVPAGSFSNSMRIESTAFVTVKERTRGIEGVLIEQTQWYARGVGLVKQSRKEYSVPDKYKAEQVTELIKFERY